MNLAYTIESMQPEVDDVQKWVDSEYQKYFAPYFKGEVDLYRELKGTDATKIADDKLEWILTYLPLELFSVSEQLSKMKTAQEVIKLRIREKEDEYISSLGDSGLSLTAKKEMASKYIAPDKLLVDIYSTIADRVSREISFSRELIMSAKKIWDARRASEVPITGISKGIDDLPDYIPDTQTYIK